MYAGRVAEEGPRRGGLPHAAPPVHAEAPGRVPEHPRRTGGRSTSSPAQPPDLRHPPPGCRFHPRCPLAMPVCCGGAARPRSVRRRGPRRLPSLPARWRRRCSCRRRRRAPSAHGCGPPGGAARTFARRSEALAATPAHMRRRRTRLAPTAAGDGPVSELLRLEGLQVHFPIRGEPGRHAPPAARAATSGRSTGSTSRSTRARCSAWSGNPDRARRRPAGSS